MTDIAQNIKQIQEDIRQSAALSGRNPTKIQLIAVSKTKPVKDIVHAFDAGQRLFGENYLQEAVEKITQLAHLPIQWHFLGPIQSNKTQAIAQYFDWVHSLERLKIARRLNDQRPAEKPPLQVCLQVNIDDEPSKSGCTGLEAIHLAAQIAKLPKLQLRGLMALPKPGAGRAPFAKLAKLQQTINDECGLSLDTLSMGMSKDMPDAITEGATFVRIGTAIFGARSRTIT